MAWIFLLEISSDFQKNYFCFEGTKYCKRLIEKLFLNIGKDISTIYNAK